MNVELTNKDIMVHMFRDKSLSKFVKWLVTNLPLVVFLFQLKIFGVMTLQEILIKRAIESSEDKYTLLALSFLE